MMRDVSQASVSISCRCGSVVIDLKNVDFLKARCLISFLGETTMC